MARAMRAAPSAHACSTRSTTTRSPVDFPDTRRVPRHAHRASSTTKDGLCAVGHLVAITEGLALARAIDDAHALERVMDMDEPAIDAWAARHGFTRLELATIQPSYGWEDPPIPPPGIEPTHLATQETLEQMVDAARADVLACVPVPVRRATHVTVRAFVRGSSVRGRTARLHVVVDVAPAHAAIARCIERAVSMHGAGMQQRFAPPRTLRVERRYVVRNE